MTLPQGVFSAISQTNEAVAFRLLGADFFSLSFNCHKTCPLGRARWLTPVIPTLWEAKAGGSRGQEIETILVNMVTPRLY